MGKYYTLKKYLRGKPKERTFYLGERKYLMVGEMTVDRTGEKVLEVLRCLPESKQPDFSCKLKFCGERTCAWQYYGVVVISDEFYEKYYSNSKFDIEPILLHELWHFLKGELSNYEENTPEILKERRMTAVNNNVVYEPDRKADFFVARVVGVDRMISAINFMKENYKHSEEDIDFELALKEFDLRIEALKNTFNK